MTQPDQARFALGENEFSAASTAAAEARAYRRQRCGQCGGPFGLIRRRRAGRQFCSAQCVESYADGVRKAVEARARWYEFLYQRR